MSASSRSLDLHLHQWNGGDLPLANCTGLRSDDIDQVRAHMVAMFCPHDLSTQGGSPPIAFRHNHAALRTLTFNATDYGHSYGQVVIAIPPMGDILVVEIVLAGEAQITQGDQSLMLRAGDLFVMGGEHPIRRVSGNGFRNFSMKVAKAELEALLVSEMGYWPGELHFAPRPVRIEGTAGSFARMIHAVCDDIDQGRGGYSHPRAIGSAEDLLKRLLLAAAPHNHSERFNDYRRAPAPFHVRRAEDFIRSSFDQPISLADLIAVSGVSGRSLHAGFRRFRDTTPMSYLRDHRLAMARAALDGKGNQRRSVTEVALNCGFSHLGRFARDYLDRYGERPSMTLRRVQ